MWIVHLIGGKMGIYTTDKAWECALKPSEPGVPNLKHSRSKSTADASRKLQKQRKDQTSVQMRTKLPFNPTEQACCPGPKNSSSCYLNKFSLEDLEEWRRVSLDGEYCTISSTFGKVSVYTQLYLMYVWPLRYSTDGWKGAMILKKMLMVYVSTLTTRFSMMTSPKFKLGSNTNKFNLIELIDITQVVKECSQTKGCFALSDTVAVTLHVPCCNFLWEKYLVDN